MLYDPEGPVAKQLTPLLVNEITSTYGIPDDAPDVAEYINVLIGNNRLAAQICADVKDVVDIPIDEAFIGRVFAEIARLLQLQEAPQVSQIPQQIPQPPSQQVQEQVQQNQQQQEYQQHQQQQQQQQHQQQQIQNQNQNQNQNQLEPQQLLDRIQPLFDFTQNSAANNAANGNTFNIENNGSSAFNALNNAASAFSLQNSAPKAFPTAPSAFNSTPGAFAASPAQTFPMVLESLKMHVDFQKPVDVRRPTQPKNRGKGGVGKDYSSRDFKQKKGITKKTANMEKALALSAHAKTVNMAPFVPRAPKGRCDKFPWCKDKECKYSHPTKKCYAYPECPNPPGTCDYLHPDQDGPLMADLEKSWQQIQERRKERYQQQVTLCKYGILCSKELCPFGHPTPANKDAKVIVPRWCRDNKNCTNPECELAHLSPNYQKPAPAPAPRFSNTTSTKYLMGKVATSLEQCKFGLSCTSASCPKRHATSNVPCRNGRNCTLPYCTFNHPIDEDCRFGLNCKNKFCYFRHPDGKEKALFQNVDTTSARSFAVPDDQVMEQAVQE